MNDREWYKNAVFYEVYVRAFCDSNGDGHGDLQGLIGKLDYIQELGVNCIWLLPTYPSPLLDDGYDIADYYGIHSDYGSLDDFKELVKQVHARGMRLITDLVVNHTSDQHPWFKAARADRNSPYRDYYVWSDSNQKYSEARIIFLDTEVSNWTWDDVAGQYFWHRFYSSQPDLNYDNPAVQEELIKVMQYWLDMGVDGFRADAVPYLYEREGTNCENLPETHQYLKRLRSFMDEHYPDKILLCEANQWPKDVRAYFGDGDEFHMGFHFPVMPRIYMALARADRTAVVDIMEATPSLPECSQWCTFLRNHDELTLEMVTEAERRYMWETYAPEPRMRLNLGIRRRLAPLMDGDRRKIELLNSILFTLPGSPILYYGDEIGMGDSIWLNDRDGVRTPMQWNASPNAGFSVSPKEKLYSPVIDDEQYGYRLVNVEAQQSEPGSLLHTLKHMIAVRKAEPVFGSQEVRFLPVEAPSILAVLRPGNVDEKVLALHNLSGEPQSFELNLDGWQRMPLRDILSLRTLPTWEEGKYKIDLQPYEYLWLKAVNS